MSMVTKCPACKTLFRVTPQQLQARQGQVRCGQCMTVFDGLGGIASLPGQAPAAAAPPPPAREEPPAAAARPAAKPAEQFEIEVPPNYPEFTLEPQAGTDTAAAEPTQIPVEPEAAQPTVMQQPSAPAEDFSETVPGPLRRSPMWAVGSALLLVALAGQAAFYYRSELAANYPVLRPVMTQACEAIGCVVPLPQRPKLISVEASDLQAVDPARPNVIQLTATLRNQARHDLGYPALDLVLTNSKDHTLARRIFMPAEYLERGKDVAAGLAANAEITVRLNLDTGDLGAAGFRLDLLPGPER